MIRYYCQFSYGGFRVFRINGEADEPLTQQEVTKNERRDFPELCEYYFDNGGVKLLYRKVTDGKIALILREIPGPTSDTDGTPIKTAIQFVGDEDDWDALNKMCLYLITNLNSFEKRFAEMFSLRGGLHFAGNQLVDFFQESQDFNGFTNLSQLISDEANEIMLISTFDELKSKDSKLFETLKLKGNVSYIPYRSLISFSETKDESRLEVRTLDCSPTNKLPSQISKVETQDVQKKKLMKMGTVGQIIVVILLLFCLIIFVKACHSHQKSHELPSNSSTVTTSAQQTCKNYEKPLKAICLLSINDETSSTFKECL